MSTTVVLVVLAFPLFTLLAMLELEELWSFTVVECVMSTTPARMASQISTRILG